MARSQIGVEKYLGLSFDDRPEPDYIDGAVVERALPTVLRSRVKALLALLFEPLSNRVRLTMMLGLRLRIEPRLFRIVDFAIYLGSRPEGRYATTPAFVTIEIISADDCFVDVTQRLQDYRRWGVPYVWLVDPQLKRLYEYTEAGLLQYASLRLSEFDFEISAQELFKDV
jgi:Uma2 family endonuclease